MEVIARPIAHRSSDRQGLTIAQDESRSIIFGMPKEAIATDAVKFILPIQDIAPFLISQV
jgi:two-component system, chemotaxis family, protein-glutamate methylesterase/glutaminase